MEKQPEQQNISEEEQMEKVLRCVRGLQPTFKELLKIYQPEQYNEVFGEETGL